MDHIVRRVLRFDRFALNLARGCLRADDQDIDLRPKAFEVLCYLAENAGRLVPKKELYEAIWPNVTVCDDALVQCIRELRQKLSDGDHHLIKTVSRRGYLLDVPDLAQAPQSLSEGAPATPPEGPQNPATKPGAPHRVLGMIPAHKLGMSGAAVQHRKEGRSMKTCRWCAEEIKDAAVKCPHCQSWLGDDKANGKVMVFVDQGLIRFAKFAGTLLGVFLIVGAALYGYDAQNAHKQAVEAQSAAQIAQNEAQKAQNAAQKSALEMQQWLAEQQKALGSRTTLVDHQIEALRLKIVQIFGRNIDISADIPDADGDSLINLARSGQGIQANVDALENRLSNLEFSARQASRLGPELSVETLDTLSRTLRVRQISSSIQGPPDVRKSYDLSFSLCVQNSDKCEEQGLDAVEKVIYRLDQRWFSS